MALSAGGGGSPGAESKYGTAGPWTLIGSLAKSRNGSKIDAQNLQRTLIRSARRLRYF
jgi:hypothetical protein